MNDHDTVLTPITGVLESTRAWVRRVLEHTGGNEEAIRRHLAFQELMAELCTDFIGLSTDEMDAGIERALEGIAAFAGAERAILSSLQPETGQWLVTHEWVAPGLPSIRSRITHSRNSSWSKARFEHGESLWLPDVSAAPPEARREAEIWRGYGVRSLAAFPVRDSDGVLIGWAGFATHGFQASWGEDLIPLFQLAADMLRNAFERRRHQRDLERSEARLNRLLEAGVLGLLVADRTGRVHEANDVALAVSGYDQEDLERGRMRWDVMTPAEYQPLTAAAVEQLERTGHCDPWEQDMYRRDGSRISVLLGLALAHGQHDRFLVFAVDVTERKRAEAELAERNRLSRLITLLSTRFIAIPAARIDKAIDEALREVGEVLGVDRCGVWMEAEDRPDSTRLVHRWHKNDDSNVAESRELVRPSFPRWMKAFELAEPVVVRNGGADLPEDSAERQYLQMRGVLSGVAVPLLQGGRVLGFASFVDSSRGREWPDSVVGLLRMVGEILAAAIERRRTEERRRNAHEELEQRVVQRTAQLEAANRELEAFSHAVSHDLRAPLRGIDGFSRILVEDHAAGLSAEARAVLERVRATCQRMGELIDALLTLSRIARSEPRRESVDLSAIARSLADALAASEPQRRVEFVIEPDLRVEGEPRLLEVLLDNLLRNSWKFTGTHDSARIELASVQVGDERVFYVRDDGVGFDPSQASRLFTPFQRLHSPREFEGHGVGLATVKRIVGIHGGRVWAEGAADQGATIYFTLGHKT
ncbi:MAG TPA: GAF domain-containing protein [Candidatus Limnocylindrales bacterium]|nr:GAF domain-containing protein [Candidatus Limnocylindrales bacterium]